MQSDNEDQRGVDFDNSLLTWFSLQHFLTAPLLRELLGRLVARVSGGAVALTDLFDESVLANLPGLESWAIRMLPQTGDVKVYLQHLVQNSVWQNDRETYANLAPNGVRAGLEDGADAIRAAVLLAQSDFNVDFNRPPFLQTGDGTFNNFLVVLQEAKQYAQFGDVQTFVASLSKHLENFQSPLDVLVCKHVGDLYADADNWPAAELIYLHAGGLARKITSAPWAEFTLHLRELIDQSLAAAIRVRDAAKAATALRERLARSTFSEGGVFLLNAPFDALTAQIQSQGPFSNFNDDRSTLLLPPLNHSSHRLDEVDRSVAKNEFNDALRKCWAVLRRQIALGLATESRFTMATYARTLLAMFVAEKESKASIADFSLAARLLVQAGDSTIAKNLPWPNKLIVACVHEATVKAVLDTAVRHPGIVVEREKVALEIFGGWMQGLPSDRKEAGGMMLDFIIDRARNGQLSFFGNHDVATRAIGVLKAICDARPEFRRLRNDAIYGMVLHRLSSGAHWSIVQECVEIASALLDLLDEHQLRQLVDTLMRLSDGLPTNAPQFRQIAAPSMRLFVSDEIRALAQQDQELGQKIVGKIIGLNAAEQGDAASLIFHLREFDETLLKDAEHAKTVRDAVETLILGVSKPTSSNAVNQIQALLLLPQLSGSDGVKSALHALTVILDLNSNRPNISLSTAYVCVLALTSRKREFDAVIGVESADLYWQELLEKVFKIWDRSQIDPRLLAGFSLPPPTQANSVLVHNWTYASMRLAHDLGSDNEMLSVLKKAMAVASLKSGIERALASGAAGDAAVVPEVHEFASETADAFYAGLGKRLAGLLQMRASQAKQTCAALLNGCFQFGPRGLDAAVLLKAIELDAAVGLSKTLAYEYFKRVDVSEELRLSLWPLTAGLTLE